jgi:hypothetical protein
MTVTKIGTALRTLVATFAIATPGMAQQSAFQSGNGQTSVYLESGSAATFNFGDTKFSIGHITRHATRKFVWGYEIFGSASSGVTTLFSSKIKVPEGGGSVVLGWHPLSRKAVTDTKDNWFLVDVGYSRSTFYVSPSAPRSLDDTKRYFDRYRAMAVLNNKLSDNILFGVAAGAERRNNLDDLSPVTFQTSIAAAPTGGAISVVNTKDGFLGDYRQYVAAPIYTDLLFILPPSIKLPGFDSQIAIDGFTRSDVASFHRYTDGGIGVFLTKKGSPTRVVGGLAASWNDGKVRVALVASYNF